jgi:hypothetical protein
MLYIPQLIETVIGAEQPAAPQATPRERLHTNIERLIALDKQLFWDKLKQAELLTDIGTVAFKVQHLAWQIQNEEAKCAT